MRTYRTSQDSLRPPSAGFSLVELTIVVVILGVLAMMGVPRYQVAVEKAKASEAYGYLAHIAKAQEMYRSRTGTYSNSLSKLSIQAPAPTHFSVGTPSSIDWETRWQLRLTRRGASSGFGAYSVAWCETGFDAGRASIPAELTPTGIGGANQAGSGSGSSGGSGSPSSSPPASSGGSSNGAGNGNSNGNGGGKGNNGVGNGDGGGRDGNRGNGGENNRGNNNGRGGNGNNGVGNGEGGGRDNNRGRGGRGGRGNG